MSIIVWAWSTAQAQQNAAPLLHLLDMCKLSDRLKFTCTRGVRHMRSSSWLPPRYLPLTYHRDCVASPSSPAEIGCCSWKGQIWRVWMLQFHNVLQVSIIVPIVLELKTREGAYSVRNPIALSSLSYLSLKSSFSIMFLAFPCLSLGSFLAPSLIQDSESLHQLGHSQHVHKQQPHRAWSQPQGWDTCHFASTLLCKGMKTSED